MEDPIFTISPQAIARGIEELLDEKEDLQERIDRAIEYIEKYGKTIEEIAYKNGTCEDSLQEILDILKGERNEHTRVV